MKKSIQTAFLAILLFLTTFSLQAQYVNIPDDNFRSFLQTNYSTCMSGGMLDTTCTNITSSTILNVNYKNISDLSGVQFFDVLQELNCNNNNLTTLVVLPTSLTKLNCSNNQLTSLVNLPTNLIELNFSFNSVNQLTSLPSDLILLNCVDNQLTTLPNLPSTLKTLNCNSNQLTAIPTLPNQLTSFSCGDNYITTLPLLPALLLDLACSNNPLLGNLPSSLPTSLKTLSCFNNGLSSLPNLPITLKELYCYNNHLTSLPALPAPLEILACSLNQIKALPVLSSLISLNCNKNKITILPSLPSTLKRLVCSDNPLTNIPALPSNLTDLYCDNNQLISLPILPSNLSYLSCKNNQLTCLPAIPADLFLLRAQGNYINCLPNLPSGQYSYYFTSDIGTTVCSPAVVCNTYSTITGQVYTDINSNGSKDLGETGYPFAKLFIQPGYQVVTADSSGNYSINLDLGTSVIQPYLPYYPYYSIVPASRDVQFNNPGQTNINNDFGLQLTASINDLKIIVTPTTIARPGRSVSYCITYSNQGTNTLSGNVKFEYDPVLIFVDASGTASQVDNTLEWNFSTLKPGESKKILVYLTLPTTILSGTKLNFLADISPTVNDYTSANNEYYLTQFVNASLDPNFKEIDQPSEIPLNQINEQTLFTYTVHFQNTGNDTAFVVMIRDTISTNFDLLEIETLAASHNYSFRMQQGIAVWTFQTILLPDSTTNEKFSHGFVKYRIIPKNTLTPGDEIKNTAHIFFDYNAPVVTNTTLNRVAMPTGLVKNISSLMQVYPNPSKGQFNISSTMKGSGNVIISNIEGKVIQDIAAEDLNLTINIDISSQPKGLYVIQLISDEGIITQKVIVN